MGGDELYKDKKEKPVLASLSDLYSNTNAISVRASGTLLVYLTLFTDYLSTFLLTTALIELYTILF